MSSQSPMIWIPRKGTDDVDWTTPIRSLITRSYGEDPDSYASECASLQRCRQDAVKGAGSDMTARDLLYKYFGQLELLELRFSEIRVNFPWRDAFTGKLTTQTSIAFEKASIIFQIASTHSAIAASQSRSDPEGIKRAFYYFRTCAGMLTYINDNFLHAPSTDLSREVVKFLVGVILAQATEVFLEKCLDEKKGNALVSKIGAQVAHMYTTLGEDVKEFMGKGIFDRNWVTIIQIKGHYFTSFSQYYRGLADTTAGKHGESLVRFTIAEKSAKEAFRLASSFSSSFVTQMSPNLPADTGTSILDMTKAQQARCTEKKDEAQRDNDLIYNAVLPAPETLAAIEKAGAGLATPIPIQDVYGTPEVQKVIGSDIFVRLIPLSVHESASVYSEEKAKLVRGEVERADAAEGEATSALDAFGVKAALPRFRAMAEGGVEGEEEVPMDVRRWKEDIGVMEEREGVEALLGRLNALKEAVKRQLDGIGRELERESTECESMRVKFDHEWTQAPAAGLTKEFRQDMKSHLGALEAAGASDQQVIALWNAVKGDVALLLSPQIEDVFRASTDGGVGQESLLDLDINQGDQERSAISQFVGEIDERLGRLNKISKERNEVLKDLKEKVQTDDVSHLLLINRRNTGVEPTLFAAELEKFRPFQQRLAQTVHHQQVVLQEIGRLWKGLKDLAGRGPGARKWEERERRKKDTIRRFSHVRDGYMEVRDGIAKGMQFYTDLTELASVLARNVKSYVTQRTAERQSLAGTLETKARLSSVSSSRPTPPPPPTGSEANFASLNLQGALNSSVPTLSQGPPPIPAPPAKPWGQSASAHYGGPLSPTQYNSPAPPPPPQNTSSYLPSPPPRPPTQATYNPQPAPPPPSAPAVDPYASLGMLGSLGSPSAPPPPNTSASPYPPPPQQQQQYGGQYSAFPPPPPPPQGYGGYGMQQSYGAPLPPPSNQTGQYSSGGAFPPPPRPLSYQSTGYGQPQPPPPQQQQNPYGQYR